MMWVAAAILVVGLAFVWAAKTVAERFLAVYSRDVTGEDHGAAQPDAEGGLGENDDEDEEVVSDADLLAFLRHGPDSLAQIDKEDWIAEKREEGLDDREIEEILRNRKPIAFL